MPVQGRSVNLRPLRGTTLVKPPGEKIFTPVSDPTQVPTGTVVDVQQGAVELTSSQDGSLRTAEFRKGAFKALQSARRRGLLKAKLVRTKACKAGASATARAAGTSGRRVNPLWSKGQGRYRTIGYRGSATVRGTEWLTKNRCDGSTLFKAVEGTVAIDDFGTEQPVDKLISGPDGSYLASAPAK
jgi:hypothetical protein